MPSVNEEEDEEADNEGSEREVVIEPVVPMPKVSAVILIKK